MKNYYVVKVGYNPGYYTSLADAQLQVKGYSGAKWKGFNNRQDAIDYFEGRAPAKAKAPPSAKTANYPTVFLGGVHLAAPLLPAKSPVQKSRFEAEQDAKAEELADLKKQLKEKTEALAKSQAELEQKSKALDTALREIKLMAPYVDLEAPFTKVWYVFGNCIYDDWKYVQSDGRNQADVTTVYTMKQAKEQVRKNGYRFCVPKYRQDTFHINDDDQRVYEIYTDGSCYRNGLPGAKAAIGLYYGPHNSMNLSEPLPGPIQTNQRAELAAILRAYMSIAKMHNSLLYEIHTDSAYAIDCVTNWYKTWRVNGWRNSNGSPVSNKDLIEKILAFKESSSCANVSLKKVQAHGSNLGNNMADNLAREGLAKHDERPTGGMVQYIL